MNMKQYKNTTGIGIFFALSTDISCANVINTGIPNGVSEGLCRQ